jgi:4-diphosphocytidyl-2-C-methyl-D-erythritol kinase
VSRSLRLIAPAKINWTLEVLRVRPDGYHELRSVLQTLTLHDRIVLTEAKGIELEVIGDAAATLRDAAPEQNLAYRAAAALNHRAKGARGVRISLEKRVPVAAGLGGGSSDAAAVLRGLNELWDAGESPENLVEIAGEIGSDPPFFVVAGTAAVRGRGEVVEGLPDAQPSRLLLATPPAGERGEKTANMFAALTPDDFSEGSVSDGLRDVVEARRAIADDAMNNVFERVVAAVQPDSARAMDALLAQGRRPHLAGAGPSFFLLLSDDDDKGALTSRVRALGFETRAVSTLRRADALRIERV